MYTYKISILGLNVESDQTVWNNLTKGNEKIVLTQVTLEMSRLYKTKNKINVMQAL